MDAADRAGCSSNSPTWSRRKPKNWPRWNRSTAARPSPIPIGDMQGVCQHPPLLRRLGRQDRGPHRAGARQLPVLHAAAAGRRRRPDHPLELPAADAGVEVGPGPGVRQHRRPQAGRADAVDGPAHRRTGDGGGLPRRRRQHRQRHGRNHRRRPGRRIPTWTRSPSPATSIRPRSSRSRRPTRSSAPPSSWAAKGPTSSSPTPTWRRPWPARSTPSTSTAASAARPAAGCSSRRRFIRSSSSGWPRRPRSARSAIRSIRRPSRGRRCRRSRWTRSSATSSWARSRARR